MKNQKELNVQGAIVRVIRGQEDDYICLTDIAKQKNPLFPGEIVRNWMRSKMTIMFLGLWEKLNNPEFNMIEFDQFRNEAGLNSFVLHPQTWAEKTNAIGITSKSGRYGGTYAHKDIAFEFASWVSVEFKLYLIKDYQRLKIEEQKLLGWSAKRELAKINYRIHTDAIQQNLIPETLSPSQTNKIYASEADVLNMAMFGQTAAQWRDAHPADKGNIRDYASINELICLSNMENINAVLINEGVKQSARLTKLNAIAIQQMRILCEVEGRKFLT